MDSDATRQETNEHHSILECPACGAPVPAVASHEDHRARWVCLGCLTVGSAPVGGGRVGRAHAAAARPQ